VVKGASDDPEYPR